MWERHPTPPQKILLCLTTSSSFPFLFSFFIVFFLLPCSHSTLFLIPFLLYLSSSFFSTPFCLASISFSLSPPPPSVRLLLPTFYMSHNVLFLFLFYFLISFFFNFSFSFCSTPLPTSVRLFLSIFYLSHNVLLPLLSTVHSINPNRPIYPYFNYQVSQGNETCSLKTLQQRRNLSKNNVYFS